MSDDVRSIVLKYALRNAVKFHGKATVGPVMGKVMGEYEGCRKDPQDTKSLIEEVIGEVNEMSPQEQNHALRELMPEYFEEKEEEEEHLPELDADSVVMRLAPYPSGPLHIGNARMVVLNDEYVKRHDGKLILFYDDTIGSETKKPLEVAYDLIKEGLDWLGVEWHETHYKSERMDLYYQYCEKLIEMGEAYVCQCSAERLRSYRKRGVECEHRSRTIEDNKDMWDAMLAGTLDEGEAVVRIKTDMEYPDPAFRDRVLFRISKQPHPRVGDKYHIWPLLEFSWAVDDHLLGMTHVLRGKDLMMEDKMEQYIWDLFGWDGPEFLHYGMLRLEEFNLSKSDFQRKLKTGEIHGWDDPRTWTLQSLRRRGIQPEAVREFIIGFGMSLTDIAVPASKLYAKNRELVDDRANRYHFIAEPVKVKLNGEIDINEAELPFHPDHPERGNRVLKTSDTVFLARKDWEKFQGKEVRFKNFCNIKLEGKKGEITGYENKDIRKIHWLCDGILARVEMPDGSYQEGLVEPTIESEDEGKVVQFERYGFVRLLDTKESIQAVFGHR
ncbi:MAG: glutamate--tRNA ligase [Thermoplasmata archaeon]